MRRLSLCVLASCVLLAACGDRSKVPLAAEIGPAPALPPQVHALIGLRSGIPGHNRGVASERMPSTFRLARQTLLLSERGA